MAKNTTITRDEYNGLLDGMLADTRPVNDAGVSAETLATSMGVTRRRALQVANSLVDRGVWLKGWASAPSGQRVRVFRKAKP